MKLHTELMNGDCIQLLENINDESVDAVVTDPPYCYLNTKEKNCDFDKRFDNEAFVAHCKRILKKSGFVVMFGRGENFYRLNTLFCDAGFKFKEDVVWNKKCISSFLHCLGRQHENIVILTKKNGTIKKRYIPFLEEIGAKNIKNKYSLWQVIDKIKNQISDISKQLSNTEKFREIHHYLNGNEVYTIKKPFKEFISTHKIKHKLSDHISRIKNITKGKIEKDIINIPTLIAEHQLHTYHPTEKPVRLMERLISLVTDEGDVICDPFMGSGTTGVACIKQNRHFVGIELDEKYFDIAYRRIEDEKREHVNNLFDILDDETIKELQEQDVLKDA